MAKKKADPAECCQRGCQVEALARCGYELRGRLSGTTCGRPVCSDHAVLAQGAALCPAHARLAVR